MALKKRHSILLIVLGWILTGFSVGSGFADEAADPNQVTEARTIRHKIQQSQFQSLNGQPAPKQISSDLDSLVNAVLELEIPVETSSKAKKKAEPAAKPAVQSEVPVNKTAQIIETATPSELAEEVKVIENENLPETKPEMKSAIVPEKQNSETIPDTKYDLNDQQEQKPDPEAESKIEEIPIQDPLEQIDPSIDIVNTLALADVLYLKGDFQRASRFYELALMESEKPEHPNSQWILYQQANCLRVSDPKRAIELYQSLLRKSPNSAWSGAAKSQVEILTWITQMDPKMQGIVSDPNSI